MIQITRNETEAVLQSFTVYTTEEIMLLMHDTKLWYSLTKYYGHCDVGAVNGQCHAIAFPTTQAAMDFIQANNLIEYGKHLAPWHFPTAFRIVQSNAGMLRMLKHFPELALYPSQAGLDVVEDGNYQYTYINYILPEHEQVFSIPEYEAQIQSNPD